MKAEVASRVRFDRIRYAQCWEDPELNRRALRIGPDDHVLSIASGGDNSFAHLLDGAASVTALDLNPSQIALCELKKAALGRFDYHDLLSFLGVRPSTRRLELYRQLRGELPQLARDYFDAQHELIEAGVIHTGKFERYFHHFRTKFLPLVESRRTIEKMAECMTLTEQRELYHSEWNNFRWRALFRIFFGEFMLGRLGRDPQFFKYVAVDQIGKHFFGRAEYAFTHFLVQENFYILYIFFGQYRHRRVLPPYLVEENVLRLRERLERIEFRLATVEEYLASGENRISAINFSDIFEYISEESMAAIFRSIAEHARPGCRIGYWNLLVPRQCPESVAPLFDHDAALGAELHAQDRSFVYSRYVVETLKER